MEMNDRQLNSFETRGIIEPVRIMISYGLKLAGERGEGFLRISDLKSSKWSRLLGGLTCSLLLLMAWSGVAQAQVRPVALAEMVESAGTIVTGRVVEVREGRHPNYPNIRVAYVTVEVEEMLKGQPNRQQRHRFMQFGGLGAGRVMDLPTYRVDEEVILFLYPESNSGFTSPVAGPQGKFYLETDPRTGQRLAVNPLMGTRLLADSQTSQLTKTEREALRHQERGLEYQVFASVVRKLASR